MIENTILRIWQRPVGRIKDATRTERGQRGRAVGSCGPQSYAPTQPNPRTRVTHGTPKALALPTAQMNKKVFGFQLKGSATVPERIQLSRSKGWRLPANTINVARPGKWGNPYTVAEFGLPLALELYERTVEGFWTTDGIPEDLIDAAYQHHCEFRRRFHQGDWMSVSSLRGWNLACWCKPEAPCHADVLLRLANPGEVSGSATGE